jgi:DNA mismatch repair ATPase MutS
VFSLNIFIHTKRLNAIRRDFDTVNYSLSMIRALARIRRLKDGKADAICAVTYDSLDRFRSSRLLGSVGDNAGGEFGSAIGTLLLWDLIAYEFQKNKLWRNHDDLFGIHECLGKLDAAIAVASYMKSLPLCCRPILDFTSDGPAYIQAERMVHPMLSSPVANDLDAAGPILITGSNASGKSTYIKTAITCAILAQSVCLCTAGSYSARAFRIYSSMAVTDDLIAGESYYIAEIRSLKRIFDAAEGGEPVLAVIDEVLRGTNTVERIAASAEVLRALREKGVLCLAATHDIELCALLKGTYELFHFEESVTSDAMTFDYRIRSGPAGTRNAINLLKLMGFEDGIVNRAHERADRYIQTVFWSD